MTTVEGPGVSLIVPDRPIVHSALSAMRPPRGGRAELLLLLADAAEPGEFRRGVYSRSLLNDSRKERIVGYWFRSC